MALVKASKFRRRSGGSSEHGHDLMITPLLDLFVALIPFLIMSIVLTRLNTVDVSLLKPGASNDTATQTQELSILLKVFSGKAELSVNNRVIGIIPRTSTDAAWHTAVHAKLVEIKKQHPKEMRVFIEAGERVSLEVLMSLMDAARELKAADGEIIREEGGKETKLRYLFPKVILKGVYS